jgi:transposase
MDAPRNGINVPKWKRRSHHLTGGSYHHDDCDSWHRFDEERFCHPRREHAWQNRAQESIKGDQI